MGYKVGWWVIRLAGGRHYIPEGFLSLNLFLVAMQSLKVPLVMVP